ncbi:gamma-glutamylcyclotransferase family protein [Streptomyces sp. NPDC059853]|uniref:gamma-glutamylcyclotransferase family protein n=1 Tax=Streptomyces sp. NPDC059853 TaxID=3346973 RepID=UPI003668A194
MSGEPERLPFFVYGTLRAGQRHYAWALRGHTGREEPAVLPGAVLYEGPGYPYAVGVPDAGRLVHGELMHIRPERFPAVLATLDRLEGPDYERLTVRLPGGARAWTYLAAEPLATRLRATGTPVPGGDWLARGG